MKKLLTAILLLGAASASGQKSFGVKVYQNTDIFDIDYREAGNTTNVNKTNFNRISLALNLRTKNSLVHELELFIPELSKSLENIQYPMDYELRKGDTFDGEVSSYSIRYELSKKLTDETKRFGFTLGAGINPYYVYIQYFPKVETTYYASSELYGFALNIVPRLEYKLSNRFHLDLNIPLKVYDLRGEKIRLDNPAIPIRQQTSTDGDQIFFESAYTIRLGLMYTLTK